MPRNELNIGSMPPGLTGVLLDNRFDDWDFAATLLDLARRRYIQIEPLSRGTRGYIFTLKRIPKEGALARFELRLLQYLFQDELEINCQRTTGQLSDEFYRGLPRIRRAAWADLRQRGCCYLTRTVAKVLLVVLGGLCLLGATLVWRESEVGRLAHILIVMLGVAIIKTSVRDCLNPFQPSRRARRPEPWHVLLFRKGLGLLFIYMGVIGVDTPLALVGSGSFWCYVLGVGCLLVEPGVLIRTKKGRRLSKDSKQLQTVMACGYLLQERGVTLADILPWAVALGVVPETVAAFDGEQNAEIHYLQAIQKGFSGNVADVAVPLSLIVTAFVNRISDRLTYKPVLDPNNTE